MAVITAEPSYHAQVWEYPLPGHIEHWTVGSVETSHTHLIYKQV